MSPARRRLLTGLLVLVVLVIGAGLAARLVGGRGGGTAVAVPQDRPGPVLLVPGYGGSTSAVEVLAGRLRAAGHTAVVVGLPGDGRDDLESYVPVLDAAVQRALDGGAPSVDVVGYSAGGVVARLWAADGGAEVARRVVTLGAPHHGTGLAALGARYAPAACPQACRQLVPGSALLDALNDGDETPAGPVWLSLWTALDETVTPPDSARLAGAVNLQLQDLCPGADTPHGGLPRDARVQDLVLAALGSGPVALPSRCPG